MRCPNCGNIYDYSHTCKLANNDAKKPTSTPEKTKDIENLIRKNTEYSIDYMERVSKLLDKVSRLLDKKQYDLAVESLNRTILLNPAQAINFLATPYWVARLCELQKRNAFLVSDCIYCRTNFRDKCMYNYIVSKDHIENVYKQCLNAYYLKNDKILEMLQQKQFHLGRSLIPFINSRLSNYKHIEATYITDPAYSFVNVFCIIIYTVFELFPQIPFQIDKQTIESEHGRALFDLKEQYPFITKIQPNITDFITTTLTHYRNNGLINQEESDDIYSFAHFVLCCLDMFANPHSILVK